MHSNSGRWVGLIYLAPALAFVTAFTAYPLVQMMWMSLHNWSLIAEKKFVGAGNFIKAWHDPQFWSSLGFTLKYTALITPILMVLGFLIALLTAPNTRFRRFTRGVVFAPVVIGLGSSSLLWYWLFSYDFGLVNRSLIDLGLIAKPMVWFGADANVAMWAVIVSIVWKVVGFGTILFVAAIHAVPAEVGEAAMVDGASYWQRVRRIILPLTSKTILLVTLVSVIGSLLAFDQFYIMTAGQPRNLTATSVFLIYLNSFPYLKLGYGAALSLILAAIILACTLLQMALTPKEQQLSTATEGAFSRNRAANDAADDRSVLEWLFDGRTKYLAGAACIVLCMIMLLPIVVSVLASLKSTVEAAAVPPTYIPHALSLDSYVRLWNHGARLPTYLMNSGGAALLTILFCLVLTIPAGYGLARFPIPGKEIFFIVLLLGLIIPYQALLTPLFFMFVKLRLHNSLVGLAIVHTAIQLPFGVYIMRNAFEAVPRELEEAAVIDGCNSWQVLMRVFMPAIVPAIITVALFAFITSWNELLAALVIMNTDASFTLPLVLSAARQMTSIGGTDWGMLQAGITISIIPCLAFYLLLQKYYVSGFLTGAVK